MGLKVDVANMLDSEADLEVVSTRVVLQVEVIISCGNWFDSNLDDIGKVDMNETGSRVRVSCVEMDFIVVRINASRMELCKYDSNAVDFSECEVR